MRGRSGGRRGQLTERSRADVVRLARRALAGAVLAALLSLGTPGPGAAHPEHGEDHFVVEVHVLRDASGLEALVRVPLGLLTGVGLPLKGARDVDVAAFRRADPVLGDGTTYAQRAAAAVGRAFRVTAGGEPVALSAGAMRLSDDDAAFVDTGAARAHLAAGPTDPEARIALHEGYLDLALTGPAVAGPLAFTPTLGGAGVLVTFHVHAPGEPPVEVPGTHGSVALSH